MQEVDDNLWYPMQHDEVVAQDTAAALEGLDITGTGVSSPGMPRAMSSDLECAQAPEGWHDYDVTEQKGRFPLQAARPDMQCSMFLALVQVKW